MNFLIRRLDLVRSTFSLSKAPADMESSGKAPGRMHSIEAARGVAALMVVLLHAANLMAVEHFSGHVGLGGFFGFGYVGVDFFFALSGFIIAFIHFDDIGRPQQLVPYIRKRLVRIFPIYWFCLALAISVLVAGRIFLGKDTPLGFGMDDVAGTVFLLPISAPKFVEVAWSLQYELMFYAAFAVLVANRRLGISLFSIWFLAIAGRLLFMPDSDSLGGLLNAYSLQFLFGVVTGLAARAKDFAWAGKPMLVAGVACFLASIYYERILAMMPHGPLGQVFLGASSALILLSLVELEKKKLIHTPRFMHRLGSVSYSIYLSHIIFLNLTYSVLLKAGLYHSLPEVLVFSIAVAVALACSALIGFLIELPLGKLLRRQPLHNAPPLPPASHIRY